MGFEPTTSTLGRWHSTIELQPHVALYDADSTPSWLRLSTRKTGGLSFGMPRPAGIMVIGEQKVGKVLTRMVFVHEEKRI